MRRSLVLIIVLMMTVGPLAKAFETMHNDTPASLRINAPETSPIQPVPDTRSLLSNLDGYFIENLGQVHEDVAFYVK